MPKYKVTSPEGKTLTLTGDSEPTEQELEQIFSSYQTENPVQQAIGQSRKLGLPFGSFTPKNMSEVKDIPAAVASGIVPSHPFSGTPILRKYPSTGMVGLGANLSSGFKDPLSGQDPKLPIPQPQTDYGKDISIAIGAAPLVTLGLEGATAGLSKITAPESFEGLVKGSEKARGLSQELLAQADEARKVAGATQGGYIDANAEAPVDPEKLQRILGQLPEALQSEIKSNPELTRSGGGTNVTTSPDALGVPVSESVTSESQINPNLKNAENIRRIIKGKVSSSYWNPRLADIDATRAADVGYENVGNLMTEGRPELGEAMQDYARMKNAMKPLESRLVDPYGFTKTKPMLGMFVKGAEAEPLEAVNALAENNPDILKTVGNISNYAQHLKNIAAAKKLALRGAGLGLLGGASGFGGRAAHEILKHASGD